MLVDVGRLPPPDAGPGLAPCTALPAAGATRALTYRSTCCGHSQQTLANRPQWCGARPSGPAASHATVAPLPLEERPVPQQPPARRRVPPVDRAAPCGGPVPRCPPSLLLDAQLGPVSRTLLIPLAARAYGGRYFPWLDCHDAVAPALLTQLGADVQGTLDDLPTVLHVLWRTQAIKDAGRAFFAEHPQALGVNLGCGLSQHFQWLDTGANRWLDADLAEVMALRGPLLPPQCPRMRHADLDLSQPGWWQRLGLPQRRSALPVLLICEGVLMYLQPAQVQAVLAEFAQCAPPGSRMVLDVMTRHAVGRAARHPSVGPTGAEFCLGVGRMAELTAVHPRLQLLREQSAAQAYGWAGLAMDMLWRPWLGAPLYGLATLGVGDGAP